MHRRVQVEVAWLQTLAAHPALTECPPFSAATVAALDALVADFSLADAARVKAIELVTNHDVKAIEYFLKEKTGRQRRNQSGQRVHSFRLYLGRYQ